MGATLSSAALPTDARSRRIAAFVAGAMCLTGCGGPLLGSGTWEDEYRSEFEGYYDEIPNETLAMFCEVMGTTGDGGVLFFAEDNPIQGQVMARHGITNPTPEETLRAEQISTEVAREACAGL